jgi:LPS-assembly protein
MCLPVRVVIVITLLSPAGWAQIGRPPYLPQPPPAKSPLLQPSTALKPIRPNIPPPGVTRVYAVTQEKDGDQYHLRGNAEIRTSEMLLTADEIDYNDETKIAEARGKVRFEHYANGEKLQAERVEYNVDEETGKFWDVSGTSPAKIDARPGILTTSNPFYFQGKWAERKKDKYILHDGFITDCQVPEAWWILKGPTFDVIPGDRAIARHSVFWLKGVPLFYAPAYYKSLKKYPRRSGFLTPNIGNSSRRGKMFGVGYYWAINRSYDVQYRNQYFTQRGFAHHVDFRGKVNRNTDFDFIFYGVNDRGLKFDDGSVRKQGGYLASFNARSEVPGGWSVRADMNYLSKFEFRQNFTESFNEAVLAESHSIGYLTKHWSSFGANIVFDRDQVFQIGTGNAEDSIVIRKLPEVEFISRARQVFDKLPFWFSLESSAGLLRRKQPLFATREFVHRVDFAPRVMTAAYWKGFSLVPAFALRETAYGSSFDENGAVGQNLRRHAREFTVDLTMPSIAQVYRAPAWMGGQKIKHVIEPRASFRDISGVRNFDRIIRFDETDIVANTREIEISVANRFYRKRANGVVDEALTWQVWQRRYFDPTFGGAVVAGKRNVVLSSADLTGYAFIDQPRSYSPIVSQLRYVYKIGVEWRTDYDPLRGHFVNSTLAADYRTDQYYMTVGHSQVRNDPVLAPSSNQLTSSFGLGKENRRGWNLGSLMFYDYKQKTLQYLSTQLTYNTDCCGFSVQYRRFGLGTRNENQFRVALSIANVGSFGTLKRQERLF